MLTFPLRAHSLEQPTRPVTKDLNIGAAIPGKRLKSGDLCPCGSKKPVQLCCLDTADGEIRVKIPDLVPPGAITGYAHPNCYLACTANCSAGISREHYISKALLKAMNQEIVQIGLPWEAPGAAVNYGLNSMTSKVLCERHNNAMSPLDAHAAHFFRTIRGIYYDLMRISDAATASWHLLGGTALELWCVKTLCGMYYSTIASSNRQSLHRTHSLNVDLFAEALARKTLTAPSALYARATEGAFQSHISFAPLSVDNESRTIGIRVAFFSCEFEVILDSRNVDMTSLRRHAAFRPWCLLFQQSKRRHIVTMTWPDSPVSSALGRRINYNVEPMPQAK
jgi:hypothetical protein